MSLRITIFGLAISSSWGNGHATTYRALCAALRARGHLITFFEKDVEWYASNRDLPGPGFVDLRLYDDWMSVVPTVRKVLEETDVAIVGSYFPDGVAALSEMADKHVPVRCFYDIDTPVTVAQLRKNGGCGSILASQLPALDLYFSFTGGPILAELESHFGVKRALPLYCSFDPDTYHRRPLDRHLGCDMSYMGTYASDRQPKLEELLFAPAERLPGHAFIVAGSMYPKSAAWPENVRHIAHLAPQYHPALYSSSRLVLNLTRREMVVAGYSPSVRLFEAAACGAVIVSDVWPGIEHFFAPGEEILLATDREDVQRLLRGRVDPQIGLRAQTRVLSEHSASIRASELERAVLSVGATAFAAV